jgi:hypothetical protein
MAPLYKKSRLSVHIRHREAGVGIKNFSRADSQEKKLFAVYKE